MSSESRLSHLDESGRARMVDVSTKADTVRVATAEARVAMLPATLALIQSGGIPKGDVFAVAQVAAVMAAKRTWELIPMCHPLPLSGIDLKFVADEEASCVRIEATVRVTGKTGVEMEALMAVSVAALTIYDMCKAVEKGMRVEGIRLLHKTGGKSGEYVAGEQA